MVSKPFSFFSLLPSRIWLGMPVKLAFICISIS